MPTADAVLAWAASVANEWRWLAIIWHVALAALLVAVSLARIQERVVARLLVLPIVSVAVLAWLSANPFNGLVFTAVGVLLLRSVKHLPRSAASRAPRGWRLDGGALVAFGWLYPHFLITDSWAAYAYASPFGLLPCPTLAVVAGVTLALGGLRSARWNTVVAAAAVLYGAIGVFRLGVILDVWLLVGGILLAATALPASRRSEESVMTRTAKRTAVGLGASFFVWLAIQAMPFGRPSANPPVVAEPAWDTAETRQLAKRACFDCHSNETRWPAYANVAPVSWLITRDVREGRDVLNFSEWRRPQKEAHESAEAVAEGEMPLMAYRVMHPEARLTAAERDLLARGLAATVGSLQSAHSDD